MDHFKSGVTRADHDSEIPADCSHRALRILDDSMGPRFPHGTILVVDTEAKPAAGSFVLACTEGSQDMFGQLVLHGGKSYINPINPRYPVVLLGKDCTIAGVVRQAIFDME